MLDDLLILAAVGTARKAAALPQADGALGELLAALAPLPPEGRLLHAITALARYESCGRMGAPTTAAVDAAPDETLSPASGRADDLLARILAMTQTATKERLALEWLEQCAAKNQRVAHRLLPALLDYGAASRAPRRLIGDVAGARGAWLMRLNPRWQFTLAAEEDPRQIWSTGGREARAAALRRLRQCEPGGARDLLQSTWKQDAADDRAEFLGALVTNLGADDEPFLEAALDDRGKQVKAVAADLLCRLPTSALVARMIDRARPLLTFTAALPGKLLRKGTAARLNVALPADAFDPAWARDGVAEKPDEKVGRRQSWLGQFLAAIPPTYWSDLWGVSAADCIAAANDEFMTIVLTAWNRAAARHPDPQWISALLLAAAREGRGPLTLELLNLLPQEVQRKVMAEVLDARSVTFERLQEFLRLVTAKLDRNAAQALLRTIEAHIESHQGSYSPYISHVLSETALRLPPSLYDELQERWSGDEWEFNRKAFDEFFQTLFIRRDIQREFNP